MMKPPFSAVLACLVLATSIAYAQAPARMAFGKANPFKEEELPAGKLKSQLQMLPPQARGKAMQWLHTLDFSAFDAAEHLRADKDGGIFIVCPDEHGKCKGHSDISKQPEPADDRSVSPDRIIEEPSQVTEPPVESVTVPVSSPPAYHSKPGATRFIYLDFNGALVSGKAWRETDDKGTPDTSDDITWSSWDCFAWGTDSDKTTFSDSEQAEIRRYWERVSEDYAPFDIDVTTDVAYDPVNYTGDKNKVGWLLFTSSTDKNGAHCPHYGAGGVAYVGVFGQSNYFATYQPAWVAPYDSANGTEAGSHEMGHNLGLSHDGTTTLSYYGGHGATASAPSWAPIMGTGYGQNVTQWSKGQYYNANQTQDDLTIIAAKVPYRADDHGNTFATATSWPSQTGSVTQKGIVETTGNADCFAFSTNSGSITFNASPYKCDTRTWGSNLDILLELYDSTQTLIATSNPAADVTASISLTVPTGSYYLVLKPTAAGTPLTSPASGYTNYGSLGQYSINGTFVPYQPSLSLTGITPTSGNSGSTVTVDISGNALAADTTVKLKQPGRADISGTSVQMIGSLLRCQFNLIGAASGLWSLHASNPDLQTASLPDAFTVNGVSTLVWGENFDGAITGWTSTPEQGTNSWNVVTAASHTPVKSYFSAGPASTSITHLTSPSIFIPSAASSLGIEFWHNYTLEQDRDCGKFYLSIDGGAWFEVTSTGSGAAFSQNGYNSTMASNGQTNPFAGQQAWSGSTSGAFVKTAIGLTDTAKFAGKNLRLRWTTATNNQSASSGWYVDSVSLSGVITTPNQTPLITTAASTSSIETESIGGTTYQIIRGASTNLSVAASDDVAESDLSYTWASTSGPAPVIFSTNGNNTAKSASVSFTQPGDYLLTVTAMDTGGLFANSSVNVRVLETQTLLVTPEILLLTVGDTRQYAATAVNQFGTPLSSQPSPINWSTSGGGTITSGGLFTANTIGGPYTITATGGQLSGTADVNISPYQANVELQNLSQFYDGTPKSVTVIVTPSWLPYSVTYNGQSTAPTAAGSYAVEATVTEPNYQGTAVGTLIIAFNVSYQGNGNTSGTVPADQTKLLDVNLTLATNSGNLNKTGYSFVGWNTAADGGGTDYPAGSIYSGNASLVLYAKWILGADGTWAQTTAGPFDWTTSANWSGGTVASGADKTASFTPNITAAQVVNLDSARTIGNITFTDSTTTSNDLTISGANILSLIRTSGTPIIDVTQSGRTLTIASQISGSVGFRKNGAGTLALSGPNDFTGGTTLAAGILSISANSNLGVATGGITLTGNSQITSTAVNDVDYARAITLGSSTLTLRNTTASKIASLSGAITGTGGITGASGGGNNVINLSSTGNTFTGNLTMQTGTGSNDYIRFASIGDGGAIIFGRLSWLANAQYTGSANLTLNTRSISLATTFGGAGGLDGGGNPISMFANNGTGTVTINPAMGMTSTATSGFLYLGGTNAGNNTFAGAIADPTGTNTLGIGKWDTGKWILSNPANTFEGSVVIANGTLSVSAINLSANAQPLGRGSLIQFGQTSSSGILEFTGTTNSTANRQIVIGSSGNTNINFTGGGSIRNNGGGSLTFTNPVFNAQATGINANRTLTLAGTYDGSTGANEIQGTIQNNTGTTNFTVGLTVSGSVWKLSGANTYSGPTTINGGALSINSIQSVNGGASAVGTPITVANGTIAIGSTTTAGSLVYTGAGNTTDRVINLTGTTGGAALDQSGTGLLKFTSNFTATGAGIKTLTLQGSTAGIGEIAGAIINNSTTNTTAATKAGTGTWILSGANSYTGTTAVGDGKLLINGSLSNTASALNVSSGATLGGTGTVGRNVTIAAGGKLEFDISTSDALHDRLDISSGRSFAFSGTSTLTIASSSGAEPGTYTLVTGGNNITGVAPTLSLPANWVATVSISGNSLLLNVTSTGQSGYQTWAGGAAFDADANNDGVKNGVAFLLGATSPISAVTRPTVTQTGAGLVINFNMLKPSNRGTVTLSVEHSRDIGMADPWTTVPVPDSSSGPTNGVTFIVTPGGGTTNAVQATISSSEAGGTGKLFGCLKALTP